MAGLAVGSVSVIGASRLGNHDRYNAAGNYCNLIMQNEMLK